MHDLITIGTVSMDLYFKGNSLTIKDNHFSLVCGGKYFVNFFHEGLGGGATNVAVAAKKTGIEVGLIAKIGNNTFKSLLLEKLKSAGISSRLCDIEDDYNNVSSILLNDDGEKTVINYRTPHQHFCEDESAFASKLQARAIYMANLPGVSLEERLKIFRIARKNGCMTFLNLGVKDCRRSIHQLESLIHPVQTLIVNRHEFADLVKVSAESLDLHNTNTFEHLSFFDKKTVIVTDGANGSFGYQNGHVHYQKAIKPHKIVDTTGAGDGYTGAFVAKYIQTQNIPTSMKEGAKYSSHKLTHLGAN